MKKTQSEYFVPALEKGLDVLEALAIAGTPQTLAELARILNRTSSELFRMIDALEKRSYIVRDPLSGGYELTLKLYQLAHTHSPVDHLLKAAYQPMRNLSEAIHESCHLSVLDRGRLLVVAQAESPEPVRLSVEIGDRPSPLDTTSGALLIAFLKPDRQESFLAGDASYTKLSAAKRKALHADFEKIRADGFYLAYSTRRTGIDISCLIGNPDVSVTAALGVPFLPGGRNEGKERKLLPLLQKCARRVTESLGLVV